MKIVRAGSGSMHVTNEIETVIVTVNLIGRSISTRDVCNIHFTRITLMSSKEIVSKMQSFTIQTRHQVLFFWMSDFNNTLRSVSTWYSIWLTPLRLFQPVMSVEEFYNHSTTQLSYGKVCHQGKMLSIILLIITAKKVSNLIRYRSHDLYVIRLVKLDSWTCEHNSVCNHTRYLNKTHSCYAVVRFCNHLYDYRPNWTPPYHIILTGTFEVLTGKGRKRRYCIS